MSKNLHLSEAQYNIWLDQQLSPHSSLYNIGGYLDISAPVNYSFMKEVTENLIRRNDALRQRFSTDNDGLPCVSFKEPGVVDFPLIDFSSSSNPLEEAKQWVVNEFKKPFNLNSGPLYTTCLIKVHENRFFYLEKLHHLICDGMGVSLLGEQIISEYNRAERGETLNTEPLESYKNYIVDDSSYKESLRFQKAEEFWKNKLKDTPPSLLTSPVFSVPRTPVGTNLRQTLVIPGKEYSLFTEISGNRPFVLFLALMYTLINRLTGFQEMTLGIPLLNRSSRRFKKTTGLFVETSPLLLSPEKEGSLLSLCNHIEKGLGETFRHQRYPAGRIEQLSPESGRLCEFILSYEKHLYSEELSTGTYCTASVSAQEQKNAMTLHIEEHSEGEDVHIHFDYRPDVFTDYPAENFIKHFYYLFGEFLTKKESLLSDYEIMSPQEQEKLLSTGRETPWPREKTVVTLFEEMAEKTPDATALIFHSEKVSFRELKEKSDRVASWLMHHKNPRPGDLIGVHMDRSPELLIAIWGILKAGAGYIPLDPSLPESRICYIKKDASPLCTFGEGGVDIHAILEEDVAYNIQLPEPRSSAYVIYTSGTTGNPKGTIISHSSLMSYLHWGMNYYFTETHGDFPLFTSLSFDLTVTSLFLPLLRGKTLHIMPQEMNITDILSMALNTADSIKLTPSHISVLKGLDIEECSVQLAIVGGEELLKDHITILRKLNPHMRIVNEYGPTETTVGCIVKDIGKPSERILIGRPIDNTRIYILRGDKVLPEGVPGEICIGGPGVAEGYLGRPELTEKKFLSSPFLSKERLYRSGDLGRWLPGGEIDFLGRIDDQVKIRGHRIEPGEIDTALTEHNRITAAVTVVHLDNNNEKRLVSYYAAKEEIEDLREFLNSRLPSYMVPSWFIRLESLPLTPNGKVDKRALPRPEARENPAVFKAPESDIEKLTCSIWKEVLSPKGDVGIINNFFELGGDSIKAIQIVSRLSSEGYKGEVADLFSHPTVKEFVKTLKRETAVCDQSQSEGVLPLTPVQKYFFQEVPCKKSHYNQSAVFRVKKPLDQEALKKAGEALLLHHDVLRANFLQKEGETVQEIPLNKGLWYCEYDLRNGREEQMEEIASAAQSSFNLESDTLIRFLYFQRDDEDRLIIIAHHLIIDGVSWRILTEDLIAGYFMAEEGDKITLPSKTTSFKEWSETLLRWSREDRFRKELFFWKKADSFRKELPEPEKISDPALCRINLSSSETETLLTRSKTVFKAGVTEILLTALMQSLKEHYSLEDFVIDTESHGRPDSLRGINLSRTVGWFTSIYPLALSLAQCTTLQEEITSVTESYREPDNYGIGYGVLKYLKTSLPVSRSQILFNYLGQFDSMTSNLLEVTEESGGPNISEESKSLYRLAFNGLISSDQLTVTLFSDTIPRERVYELLSSFKQRLKLIIKQMETEPSKEKKAAGVRIRL